MIKITVPAAEATCMYTCEWTRVLRRYLNRHVSNKATALTRSYLPAAVRHEQMCGAASPKCGGNQTVAENLELSSFLSLLLRWPVGPLIKFAPFNADSCKFASNVEDSAFCTASSLAARETRRLYPCQGGT